jgi:hypothetical protein
MRATIRIEPCRICGEVMNILAIDQAAVSGWSLWLNSKPSKWGEAKGPRQCADVIQLAGDLTRDEGGVSRVLVVFEDHSNMRMMGQAKKGGARKFGTQSATLLGMGRAHGWWECCLELVDHDHRARIKVDPKTWKSKVLGNGSLNRDDAIKAAQRHAEALGAVMPGPDEAVACVMAHYATLAPEAREAWERAYGPKARKRKGAA